MMNFDVTKVLVVTTTVGSMPDAMQLAKALVERELAACVQLEAIATSVYRWEGKLCEEPEVRLTMKTLHAMLPELRSFIDEHHPYDLPQLTWVDMECTPAYGAWVQSGIAADL